MAAAAQKIQHVRVDPALLPGFLEQYEQDVLQVAESEGFHHDPDWVEKICDSIRKHRLALIKLPPKYAALYKHLLQPATFPSVVKDMEVSGEVKKTQVMLKQDVLPADLLNVLGGWSTVCEHVTKHVAQHLRRLVNKRPLEPRAHHESHGQCRVAINCDTEPHNDNSYVTMLGTGNMRGTLKLEIPGRDEWPGCEDFIEEVSASSDMSDGPTFFMFAGSKLCLMDGEEYRPLNHVVEWNREQISKSERINVTYFVRRYDEGYEDATHDITSTELQFQHWNRIIMQSELQHRPPRPPPVVVPAGSQVPSKTAEEEFFESGLIDWSSDGVMDWKISGKHHGNSNLWNSLWRRLGVCFLGLWTVLFVPRMLPSLRRGN
eukprot:TRINITY_DN73806_c0_g1_i1.p1 TRINITY_DN73806_c0_g1~~TRINITY_DN73806_c0_g1_i1.p1  ORF type:complete len:384 (+),score=71.81 TRINITY_DN73806_c0_g1_i1:29-1153(+)